MVEGKRIPEYSNVENGTMNLDHIYSFKIEEETMAILRFPFQSLYATLNQSGAEEQVTMVNYVNHLKQADIFYQLTHTQLEMIADICREVAFQTDEVIFPEGSESDELYIIIQGEVEILVDPTLVSDNPNAPQAQATIAKLRRGQSFGEIALVDQGLRSATTRASQNNTRLLVISRQNLMEICEEFPQLGFRVMKNLAADLAFKLRSTDLRLREDLLDASTK
jgi:CRP/FNR family transcriptional regulator, cyclic AMP receptor protein